MDLFYSEPYSYKLYRLILCCDTRNYSYCSYHCENPNLRNLHQTDSTISREEDHLIKRSSSCFTFSIKTPYLLSQLKYK